MEILEGRWIPPPSISRLFTRVWRTVSRGQGQMDLTPIWVGPSLFASGRASAVVRLAQRRDVRFIELTLGMLSNLDWMM